MRTFLRNRIALILPCSLLFISTACLAEGMDRTPEQATGRTANSLVQAQHFMVATANPYATQTAYRIIQQGGSAADAAIAATMILSLVEPQSSGLGGGCFSLFWKQTTKRLQSYDGRETAPQSVDQDLFFENGKPLDFLQAVPGGRSVGTPGQLKSLQLLHKQHGLLPWSQLFSDAIALAENGFTVSPRLAILLRNPSNQHKLQRNATANRYFYPNGTAVAAGDTLKNPSLASTFRLLAETGDHDFYQGNLAKDIAAAVQQDLAPGKLTLKDLKDYRAKQRPPVCGNYRNNQICGMPPPSSGGISLLQMLGILELQEIAKHAPDSTAAIHLFAQAGRLAFADRALYLADPEYITVPATGLLNRNYLKKRSNLIRATEDMGASSAGLPPGVTHGSYQQGNSPEQPGTSHLSIIDRAGNAIALTASVEQAFGSGIMVGGFLLNNQLTDFSFRAKGQDGQLIANRVQGGKRPRSSMAPTLVFDSKQQLKMVIGSPGGSRIIPYVVQTIIGVLDWQMSMQEAIDQPHYLHRNGRTLDLERNTPLEALTEPLKKYGYQIKLTDLNSGLQGILVTEKGLSGGSDPRREGLVLGQ